MVLGFYNSIVPLFSYEIPRLLKSSKTNRDNGEFIQRFYFISDPNLDNSPDNTAQECSFLADSVLSGLHVPDGCPLVACGRSGDVREDVYVDFDGRQPFPQLLEVGIFQHSVGVELFEANAVDEAEERPQLHLVAPAHGEHNQVVGALHEAVDRCTGELASVADIQLYEVGTEQSNELHRLIVQRVLGASQIQPEIFEFMMSILFILF